MRIQTLSILAGSAACNARCPFCISKMTPPNGVDLKEPEVDWRNFRKACELANRCGVTTAMITSKGEPTLFPDQITKYLAVMDEYKIPIVELQTNGISIADKPEMFDAHLKEWHRLGLTTMAVSIVHFDTEKNREIYLPYRKKYIDLAGLIKRLHDYKFSVRLACIMAKDFIDDGAKLEKLIRFAKVNAVEQLTIRPVNKPEDPSLDPVAWKWTMEHHLPKEGLEAMENYLSRHGKQVMQLIHGAKVFDVDGQNVCLTDCLSLESNSEDLRQLIFFPDGHLRYDWQYAGAILL